MSETSEPSDSLPPSIREIIQGGEKFARPEELRELAIQKRIAALAAKYTSDFTLPEDIFTVRLGDGPARPLVRDEKIPKFWVTLRGDFIEKVAPGPYSVLKIGQEVSFINPLPVYSYMNDADMPERAEDINYENVYDPGNDAFTLEILVLNQPSAQLESSQYRFAPDGKATYNFIPTDDDEETFPTPETPGIVASDLHAVNELLTALEALDPTQSNPAITTYIDF